MKIEMLKQPTEILEEKKNPILSISPKVHHPFLFI